MFAGRARSVWSFRALLFVQGALLAVAPLLIVALTGWWLIVPQVRDEVERGQESMTLAAAAQIEIHLASAQRELLSLATLIGLNTADPAGVRAAPQAPVRTTGSGNDAIGALDFNAVLDVVVGHGLLYEAIYLARADGIVTALGLPVARRVARPDMMGSDLSRRDFVQEALRTGDLVWSSAFLSAVTGRLAVAVAVPVRQGVLVAELALGQLSYFLGKLPLGEDATALVVDRRGQVIGHPRPGLAEQRINVSQEDLIRAGFTHGRSFGPLQYEGEAMVGATRLIDEKGWLVLVGQPTVTAYRLVDSGVIAMLGGFGVAILLSVLLAFRLAAGTARRLAAYSHTAGEMANGNYDLAWPTTRVRELDGFGHSLQRMVEAIKSREHALKSSEERLQHLNATLELRVEERTAALASANAELQQTVATLQLAQDNLIRAEKLAALGALVAGIAHELNSPIGNGLLAASTLDDHLREFSSTLAGGALRRSTLDRFVSDVEMATAIVVRNMNKASELVTSFKQVAVDRTSAQRRRFTLDELVSEIVLTLRPTFRKTPYVVNVEPSSAITLDSYPGPLGQLLTNLLNNAIVHGFEGRAHGTVTICAQPLGTDRVRVQVSDDGCGVPAEHLPHIFDPFFTTKLGNGGSGLGLHIGYNIVTSILGGEISVSSSTQGTRFTIDIPLHAPHSA